jgi:hypothetical protein
MLIAAIMSNPTLTLILVVVVFFLIGYLIYKGDARIEQRREHALEIAAKARDAGFEVLPQILERYAIGDYSGVVKEVAGQYRIFKDDDLRRAAYEKFLRRQLDLGLKDPEKKTRIYEAVDAQKILDAAAEQAIVDNAKKK